MSHKRECHKCQYNGKASPVCLKCPGPAEKSYKGVNFVFLDDIPDPEGMVDKRIDRTPESMRGEMLVDGVPTASRDIPHVSKLPAAVEEALIPIVATFMSLTMNEMIVLWCKYNGKDDQATADVMGVTKQRVNAIVHAICTKNPTLVKVIQAMRRIGIGGARRGTRRDGTFQPDLFGSSYAENQRDEEE